MPNHHLIIGLGNPGDDYAMNRHNVGFRVVDEIATQFGCPPWKSKFKGYLTTSQDPAFVLLKPMTYMNLSGEAVGEALRFHKMVSDQVIVFHDDLDVLPGQVRIKQGGGSGGHNGLKSIDQHIGQDYWRVRIGIGHPGAKGDIVTNYVLGNFAKDDAEWLDPLLQALAKNFDILLKGKNAEYLSKLPLTTTQTKLG
jgi:PTH1 family peptidyl-tRNA hydrolase